MMHRNTANMIMILHEQNKFIAIFEGAQELKQKINLKL